MRALLVNPVFPDSYWSGRSALSFARKRCLLPPLSLMTVAALLPEHWSLRLIDLNVTDELSDTELSKADIVMLTGMVVQKDSMLELIGRCKQRGIPVAVGGPYASESPEVFSDVVDHLFIGEGEEIVPQFANELEAGRAQPVYRERGKPEMSLTPVPRYDLIDARNYHQMSLQYSRGCPFKCEFCDIWKLYGNKPRVKSAEQIVAELEAIRLTGFAGSVFFVDDNFIGNKKAVRTVLPHIAEWRRRTRAPFDFYTEASINLADDDELVRQMTSAGFGAIFTGIESPSEEVLRETNKLHNLKRDLVSQIRSLQERGLDVWAGFILGFDNDGPDCFNNMIRFIESAAIPYAMVGLLAAMPDTPLYQRLEREGRLRDVHGGDQFGMTNFETKLPAHQLLDGYRRVLEALYSPRGFFERCRENLSRWTPVKPLRERISGSKLVSGMRAFYAQGFKASYRREYWRFIIWVAINHPKKLERALTLAAAGHHYLTYTRDVVIPRLEAQLKRHLESESIPATT